MVILPDVRGLHDFYKELAQRFAEIGIDAIAFDYFGRTAGIGARGEEFAYREHVEKLDWSLVDEDAKVAAEYLRSPAGGEVRSIFTVGFCFGGAMSWRQSAAGYGIDGAIGFYGQPARTRSVMADMKAPLLLLVAGADFTPLEEFEKFSGELTEAGVVHRMKVYEGAPHSFFDRTFAEHAEACQDAWAQILEFVRANKTE
jgi:carboxymethylenebutenolidase